MVKDVVPAPERPQSPEIEKENIDVFGWDKIRTEYAHSFNAAYHLGIQHGRREVLLEMNDTDHPQSVDLGGQSVDLGGYTPKSGPKADAGNLWTPTSSLRMIHRARVTSGLQGPGFWYCPQQLWTNVGTLETEWRDFPIEDE